MKLDEVRSARFLVLGAARSGIAAARLLHHHGANVIVGDSKSAEQATAIAQELQSAGIPTVWGDEAIAAALPDRDIIVKSPGIPQENQLIVAARAAGARIISEIELASAFLPAGARVIAITGTNGKTTVTSWTAHVLAGCGFHAVPAGNIGQAWAAHLIEGPAAPDKTVYVIEVSSFQLEDLEDFRPDVAVLTNLSPDHMDRYQDSMELYAAAKANLLRNMTASDVFIWNGADPTSIIIADKAHSQKWTFFAGRTPGGAENHSPLPGERGWERDGVIMIRSSNEDPGMQLMNVEDLPIPGQHNLENALAVILACRAVGAQPEAIAQHLMTFGGVEHRIEFCGRRRDGVAFYNDSKATNLDAMEKAVVAFHEPMVLIAGGRDAHSDYASINHLITSHVAQLITLGEAAPLIENAWGKLIPTQRADTMEDAVMTANRLAKTGQVVVFSPACKSFDMYSNYEERGRDFKAKVAQALAEQQ